MCGDLQGFGERIQTVAEDVLCPHCAAWMCRWDDAWCGNCGGGCAQLELEVSPSVLHAGQRPPRLLCRITNHSCMDLEVIRVEKPDWIRLDSEAFPPLEAGVVLEFFLEAGTQWLCTPGAGVVEFHTLAGKASARVRVIEENPELVCIPGRLVAWAGAQRRKNPLELTLAPAAGELRLRDISLAGVDGSVTLGKAPENFVLTRDAGLPLTLHLDTDFTPAEKTGSLKVDYDSPHGVASVYLGFSVVMRKPPQLCWAGAGQQPEIRYQTVGQVLSFEFHNQDTEGGGGGELNSNLILEAIQLRVSDGRPFPIKLLSELPATVPGGTSYPVQFEVDFSSLEGESAQQIEFTLILGTNLPALKTPVVVTVEPMPVFPGVMAIDFGSSSSCCAVWKLGEAVRLVSMDGNGNSDSATAVRYLSLSGSAPEIAYSLNASPTRAVGGEHEEAAASFADRIKQRLGDELQEIDILPLKTRAWGTRKASEAAADYFAGIRRAAEKQENASFKDFILTYPSRCSLRQLERMRGAVLTAFGAKGTRVTFLAEPIGALIPLIAKRARLGDGKGYVAASIDLGAGGTNWWLVAVKHSLLGADQLEVETRTLSCRGTRFGGENLTEFIAEKLAGRCQEALNLQGAGAILIAGNTRSAPGLDVRRNGISLREAAENFKASISEEPGASMVLRQLSLRVMKNDRQGATANFDFAQILGIGLQLRDEFLIYAREQIRAQAGLLREAVSARKTNLDVIQFSGKTAWLPVVREVFAEVFPGVPVERVPDLKECVARGACLLRSLESGPIVLRLDAGVHRMTSTIGAFGHDSPHFVPIFEADEEVPPEGITRELPLFWDGVEAVALWEDLENSAGPREYLTAAKCLTRLGIWEPLVSLGLSPEERWTLRVTLRDFSLAMSAIGPNGEKYPFRPVFGG